jgi:glycosyltransferase involved in cell wall biosynthesis
MTAGLPHRVGIQQRVLPAYRAAFFDSLARALPGKLTVFAGTPGAREGIGQAQSLRRAEWIRAANRTIGAGRLSALRQGGWREWVEAADPELLILEANPRYLSNASLMRWMNRRGRPAIGWSLGPVGYPAPLRGWVRSFYQKFSALIVYGRNGADAFRKFGIPGAKIFVAPNAVESDTAEKLLVRPRAREEARARLGLDSRPAVLFVGRLQKRKRVDSLLRACAKLGGAWPDRARRARAAAEMFPSARFTGEMRGEALGGCFLAADLFILPGTGGLALQEAMLYGKPVAAAEADGSQRDLIREGENGWMLPPGDEEELLRVLREALADPQRLERMGAASRALVRKTATMDKMVEGFLSAMRFVMGRTE